MTSTQKTIAMLFLVLEARILNATFCRWKGGFEHAVSIERSGSIPDYSGLIRSFGPFGVYARGYETVATDTVMGICVPLAFLGLAMLVCTFRRNDSTADRDERRASS